MSYIIPYHFKTINNLTSPSIMRLTKYLVFYVARTGILLNDEFTPFKIISNRLVPYRIE